MAERQSLVQKLKSDVNVLVQAQSKAGHASAAGTPHTRGRASETSRHETPQPCAAHHARPVRLCQRA
jgi:hypothetical protein